SGCIRRCGSAGSSARRCSDRRNGAAAARAPARARTPSIPCATRGRLPARSPARERREPPSPRARRTSPRCRRAPPRSGSCLRWGSSARWSCRWGSTRAQSRLPLRRRPADTRGRQARIGTARAHAPSCPAGRAGDWWSVPGASDAPRCLPIRYKQSQRVPKPRPRLRASAHRDQCPPPCRRWTAPRVFADAQTRRPCTGTLAHPRPASGTIGRTNMLHDFLEQNRARLIERCRSKVLLRRAPPPTPGELEHGIPLFLGQLIDVLRIEERYGPRAERRPATPGSPPTHLSTEIDETATKHGSEMLLRGFTINQVVHDYGDLCQSITELAAE